MSLSVSVFARKAFLPDGGKGEQEKATEFSGNAWDSFGFHWEVTSSSSSPNLLRSYVGMSGCITDLNHL